MLNLRFLRVALKTLAVLLLLVVVAAGAYVWRSFPTLDGELRVAGLSAPVQVRRDASDVTHIEAGSLADAYFALGYIHAQERSWQLEFNRRLMHGELSEVFGPATLETDRLLRRLGIMRAAQAQWEGLSQDDKALIAAYANGINAFHATSGQALPPEFHLLGVKPGEWKPQDTMGWALMMALDLGGNWGTEFARLSALQRISTAHLWELMPPYPGEAPATSVDLAQLYRSLGVFRSDAPVRTSQVAPTELDAWREGQGHLEGVGSNNWVIDGTHTQSGKPLLANDPHLGLSAPAIWYFAAIKAPMPGGKTMDVIGATLPGAPAVVLGRTAGVAWAITNTGPDTQDLYLEQIDTADPKRYRTPTGWAEFEQREETIHVKGQPDDRIVMRSTRHGPVMSDGNKNYEDVVDTSRYALALRWTALGADNRTMAAGLQANLAQNTDELLAAFAQHQSPVHNLMAADTRGKTMYHAVGVVPLRGPQDDIRGIAPAPGWDARYDWAGWVPMAQLPHVDDEAIAAKGWHATANQRIHAKDYPIFIGADWITPERFDRIETLLAATPRHDMQSVEKVQGDIVSLATQRLLPVLLRTQSSHPQAQAALAQLKGFDGTMRAQSAAPLVFAVWADELTRALVGGKLGEGKLKTLYGKRTFRSGVERMLLDKDVGAYWCAPLSCEEQSGKALDRALDRIVALQGADVAKWRWGAMHPALSGHKPFTNVALLSRFFDVQVETGGDPWTVNVGQYWANMDKLPFATRHAPSLRAVYDLADPDKSQFVYQTGQSGLVFSSRYRDMKDEWAQVHYRPLQLKPAAWVHESVLVPAR